ncbi:diguanylate cyclase (GGDEF) domain-containing protein [Amycolatopsis tolypomycina]|uniref:Diguanylate cyclase (GGDEF) domain-containing protein n=1 Tax=Amycolatopsis tolypomycina TaxID=208445 RepID=A0A1H4JK34_9PSEU|nr:GGDEF domain-containing protein [Amycolatopsis tolypomycina]SEB45992.1 diguanylate cyclase (GGDEF) domain-containing protein [Amycolatopsis tolypomycina]
MQRVAICLTRMISQVRYAARVISHPRSRWRLWEWGRRPVTWALIAEPLVLAWAAVESVDAFGAGIDAVAWVRFAFLCVAAVVYVIGTNVAEERRRGRAGDKTHVDHTSLVFFAAAVVLPVPLAIVLIALVRFHRWWIARKPVHKFVHSSVAICCSALGVHGVAGLTPLREWVGGVQVGLGAPVALGLVGAVAAYYAAQTVMVGAARGLASSVWDQAPAEREDGWRGRLWVHMVGDRSDNAEIVVTLLIAAMITWWALAWLPVLLFVIPVGAYLTIRGQRLEEKQQEIDDLARTAEIDTRTGLLMVAAFEKATAKVLSRAVRGGEPTSLLIIDIDHFKKVNDTFGHTTGDEVLAAIGELLRDVSRPSDLACRWGGEEMVLLLPDTDLVTALAVAERIRAAVEAMTIPITKAAGGDVWYMGLADHNGVRKPEEIRTVSIGVASIPVHGDHFGEAFERADQALYAAKAGGRNRVRAAEAVRLTETDQVVT